MIWFAVTSVLFLGALAEAFSPLTSFPSTFSQPAVQRRPFSLSVEQIIANSVCSVKMSRNEEPEAREKQEETSPAIIFSSDSHDATKETVETPNPVPEYRKRTDIVNDESKVNQALGLGRGGVLLAIALLINVWFFTIPTEFRRTRLCNETDTRAYPELCMTPKMFVSGIAEYYKTGGGINFDFSIEGRD
ncbi:hypothetical protein IV203_001670 [Nitzschia inconspicua]|uniref:Uncharacterized protein n=1 Tax=Nitzschia inconspicua TaxID=303405 RepID=A0A9K3PRH9_9STRA|nr:hypothetical protein IV203_001670 [Nitzschia inconspicua]